MNPPIAIRFWLLSFLLLFITFAIRAQSSGSGISGFIYDESGHPFEAATIAVTNTSTGVSTTNTTDKKGYFALRDLPVGPYDISISAVGAQSAILKNNVLNLGDRLVLHK